MFNDAVPVEVEDEELTVPERTLTMAELAVRCSCGCRRGKHTDGAWECQGCSGCFEFTAAATCSVCEENGVEHIPEGEE